MTDVSGAVLVVDDDEACRELLAALIEGAGYAVVAVESGERALSLIRRHAPAAVVVDVHLLGMSGYEVCRRLRDRFGETLPIMFVSGERTEALDRTAGLLLGADDYVAKPFDAGELIARLRRLLVRSGARVTQPAYELTERELQILSLLADGLDQHEVASRLVISSNTVATHVQRILGKLGVRSRAQAVAIAYRDRLIPRQVAAPSGAGAGWLSGR